VDSTGTVSGQEEKEVYRNTWQIDVERPQRWTSTQSAQATSRDASGGRERGAPANGTPPTSTRTPRHSRTEESVDAQRAMQLTVIVAAMRAQGFSERSISRVDSTRDE
jgi:hypothetical protein